MRKTSIIVLLLLIVSSTTAKDITTEFAAGIGSPVWIFSDNWKSDVSYKGLFFKEYALRVSYEINNTFGISSNWGWIREKERYLSFVPEIPPDRRWSKHEITYWIPSIKYSLESIGLELGTIIYRSDEENLQGQYPFNGSHRFKPSLGLELGAQNFFMLYRLNNAIPLYAGGGGHEMGIGRRSDGLYEHKIVLYTGVLNSTGFGYRGEIRVWGKTALALGIMIGGWDYHDEIYSFVLGVKTIL